MADSPSLETPLDHGHLVRDSEWHDWLGERGYLSGLPEPSEHRTVFFESSRRQNARREDGIEGRRVYDKLLFGKKDAGSAHHEWTMLQQARAAGLRVPRPLCAARFKIDGRPVAMLVTEELHGRSLDTVLRDPPTSSEERRALAVAVGQALASLHEAGLTFPSAFAKHVIIDDSGSVGFLDLADATARSPRPIDRARDLGALGATLPRWPVSRGLRLLFLRAYLDAAAARWSLRDAWRDVARAIDRRMRRRRFRIRRAGTPVSPRTVVGPGAGIRLVSEESGALERLGGIESLALAGPPREQHGDLVVTRTTRERASRVWSILELLHAFDIPAPHAVAMRFDSEAAVLLRRDARPATRDLCLDERLLPVLTRLFRAGLAPRGTLTGALVMDEHDTIHILEPEFDQPAVIHDRRLIRRFRSLMNGFVRRGMDPACARALCRELRAPPLDRSPSPKASP